MSDKNITVVDVLTADVCRLVIGHLSALACAGQHEVLLAAGIPKSNIKSLKRMSYEDSWVLSQKAEGVIDLKAILKGVFVKNVPQEYEPYMRLGANNKFMTHYFRVHGSLSSTWRRELVPEKIYRARILPNKKYKVVMDQLKTLVNQHTQLGIPPETLFEIAQQHQVSLGAIWYELEKWDEDDEE